MLKRFAFFILLLSISAIAGAQTDGSTIKPIAQPKPVTSYLHIDTTGGIADTSYTAYIGGKYFIIHGKAYNDAHYGVGAFTFGNGLTSDGFGNITWGGGLNGNTTVTTGQSTLNFTGTHGGITGGISDAYNNITITSGNSSTNGYLAIATGTAQISISNSSNNQGIYLGGLGSPMYFTDNINNRGFVNAGDYEANFVARSVITKQYADSRYALAGGSSVSSFNTRTGAVTLTNTDVTNALTYFPEDDGNKVTSITASNVLFPTNSAVINYVGSAYTANNGVSKVGQNFSLDTAFAQTKTGAVSTYEPLLGRAGASTAAPFTRKISFVGTSLTAGVNNGGITSPTQTFVYQTGQMAGYSTLNYGVGGRAMQSLTTGDNSFTTNIGGIPPPNGTSDILVLETMVNDVEHTGYTSSGYSSALTAYVNAAITVGWSAGQIILYNPSRYNTTVFGQSDTTRHTTYTAAMQSVATSLGTKYLDTWNQFKHAQDTSPAGTYLYSDSLHMTPAGQAFAAGLLTAFINTTYGSSINYTSSKSTTMGQAIVNGDLNVTGVSYLGKLRLPYYAPGSTGYAGSGYNTHTILGVGVNGGVVSYQYLGIGTDNPLAAINLVGSGLNSRAIYEDTATPSSGGGGILQLTNSTFPTATGQRVGGITFGTYGGTPSTQYTMSSIESYSFGGALSSSSLSSALSFQNVTSGTTRSEYFRLANGNVIYDTAGGILNGGVAYFTLDAAGGYDLKSTSLLPVTLGGTGNATGTATSTTAAATFNNSNTGAASGTTFNGSTAQTISTNTIGAANLNANNTYGNFTQTYNAGQLIFNDSATPTHTATFKWNGSSNWYFSSGDAFLFDKVAVNASGLQQYGPGSSVQGFTTGYSNYTMLSFPTTLAANTAILFPNYSGTLLGYTAATPTSGYIPVANGTNFTLTAPTGSGAPVEAASPTLTGTPSAPTATAGTSTTQLATTSFVTAAIGTKHTKGSITLTAGVGTVTITGLTTSSIATTGFIGIGGTVSTTWQYKSVCTANTLTITAITNTGSVDNTDTSTISYQVDQ